MTRPEISEASQQIASLRERIDAVDLAILDLLNQRAAIVEEVGRVKQAGKGISTYVPRRERDILERLSRENQGPFPSRRFHWFFVKSSPPAAPWKPL